MNAGGADRGRKPRIAADHERQPPPPAPGRNPKGQREAVGVGVMAQDDPSPGGQTLDHRQRVGTAAFIGHEPKAGQRRPAASGVEPAGERCKLDHEVFRARTPVDIDVRLKPDSAMTASNAPSLNPSSAIDVGGNLALVRARIAAAAEAAGRAAAGIELVAVSKGHAAERIAAAIAAGQRVFGENRVQEAERKWPALKAAHPDLRLHLIGPLQTNKVRDAVALFDVIESVDRPKLAEALAVAIAKGGRAPACFIQVNTGEEPQKAGVAPTAADGFIAACRERWKLPIVGLMCIPPLAEEPAFHFALLREIARRNGIGQLSMGMSADYEIAIAFGATHVRVGTAIFGERPVRPA
jgi:pyridoxal phosphate enzyme (YggS family)